MEFPLCISGNSCKFFLNYRLIVLPPKYSEEHCMDFFFVCLFGKTIVGNAIRYRLKSLLFERV